MPVVNIHEAKTHLSSLLSRMESGEDVVIARNGKPIARLAPIETRSPRKPGRFKGQIEIHPSFDDPLDEELIEVIENGHGDDPLLTR